MTEADNEEVDGVAVDSDEPVEPVAQVAADDPDLLAVIETSRSTLLSLVGTKLDAVTVKSVDPSEAPLLGANVSKLSPLSLHTAREPNRP